MPLTDHPAFRLRPDRIQIARDGAWESAWCGTVDQIPSAQEIAALLHDRREIAFEAFFGAAFFGVRFEAEPTLLRRHVTGCLAAARDAANGSDFFARLAAATGVVAWGATVDFCELGAVNAWKSTGAIRLPPPAALYADERTKLPGVIACSPLARNTTHPKAIEFAASQPLPHWFGLPISAHTPPYAVDPLALEAALTAAAALTR